MTTTDPTRAASFDRIAAKADEIEAELKRIGYWQAAPLDPAAYNFTRPFAGDTMSFPQWLQFVFLPRVRDLVAKRGELPDSSMVGAYAGRELDGDPNADQLCSLLSGFDAIFGTPQFDLASTGGGGTAAPRFTPVTRVLAWTAVAAVLGLLFYAYASRLAPTVRDDYYTFAA